MRTQCILFFEKLESNIFYIYVQMASHGKCVYSDFMQATRCDHAAAVYHDKSFEREIKIVVLPYLTLQ